jgi:small subunit ribosomal protein S8e
MAITQHRSKRKASGGKYHSSRQKRVYEIGNHPILTQIGETKSKTIRGVGANTKQKLMRSDSVNVMEKGKAKSVKITTVLENPANSNFTRRNIITKGTVVDTEDGKVKITSRPGQHGTLNGIKVK